MGTEEREKPLERWQIKQERYYTVVKSNDLVRRAQYDFSVSELKTLAFIYSKIKPGDERGKVYTFSIKEYCQVRGIECSGRAYNDIKASIKRIADKSVWAREDNGDETLVRWIGGVQISRGSGRLRITIDDNMHRYISDLYGQFTQYELYCILPMKLSYSIRLYEVLKSYASIGSHTFTLDELRKMLSVQPEQYKLFADFRKRCIEPAVVEINRFTDLFVQWEAKKTGKATDRVYFEIAQKANREQWYAVLEANKEIDGQMNIADYLN